MMTSSRRSFLQSVAALSLSSSVFADSKPVSGYRLEAYTASWCGWCLDWKAKQKDLIESDVHLIDWDELTAAEQRAADVKGLPTFRLKLFHQGKWKSISRGTSTANRVDETAIIQWTGFQSAETINREIERQQRLRSHRKTIEELRHWIHANYTANTATLHADVVPRSNVWNHLTNDHGFTALQITGLSQWEALALHSGAHRGTIS